MCITVISLPVEHEPCCYMLYGSLDMLITKLLTPFGDVIGDVIKQLLT